MGGDPGYRKRVAARVTNSFVVIALCLTATLAQSAGFQFMGVPATAECPSLRGAIWYPCSAQPAGIDLGSAIVPGVKDCLISGDKFPLVIVSHGAGGSFIDFHDTAETLATAGFIVAAIPYPTRTVLAICQCWWSDRPMSSA